MSERARQLLAFGLALVFTAAFFVLVLGVGFALNPPDTFGFSREIFPAAVTLLLAWIGLAVIIRSLRGSVPPPLRRMLPRRARRIVPTEAQLAYDRDPTRLATCPHLQPIERDIRAQGIPVCLRYRNVVIANCHIDEGLLRQRYVVVPPVYYVPDMPGDRFGDPETALFSCREHSSVIEVAHRSETHPSIRTFPAG